MNIVINDTLEFNSESGVLSKKTRDDDTPASVALTRTAARLLLILLTHHNEILSRDFLMDSVWAKHNLKPSNASLNNNITLLRKSLTELGASASMIITHPKMGIELQCCTTVVTAEDNDLPQSTPGPKNRPIKIILFLFIVSVMMAVPFMNSTLTEDNHYKRIGEIDRCSVYLIRPTRVLDMDYVKKAISDLKLDCKNNKSDLYVDADGVGRARAKNTFIFFCKKDGNNKYSSCDNFISYTEKTPL